MAGGCIVGQHEDVAEQPRTAPGSISLRSGAGRRRASRPIAKNSRLDGCSWLDLGPRRPVGHLCPRFHPAPSLCCFCKTGFCSGHARRRLSGDCGALCDVRFNYYAVGGRRGAATVRALHCSRPVRRGEVVTRGASSKLVIARRRGFTPGLARKDQHGLRRAFSEPPFVWPRCLAARRQFWMRPGSTTIAQYDTGVRIRHNPQLTWREGPISEVRNCVPTGNALPPKLRPPQSAGSLSRTGKTERSRH